MSLWKFCGCLPCPPAFAKGSAPRAPAAVDVDASRKASFAESLLVKKNSCSSLRKSAGAASADCGSQLAVPPWECSACPFGDRDLPCSLRCFFETSPSCRRTPPATSGLALGQQRLRIKGCQRAPWNLGPCSGPKPGPCPGPAYHSTTCQGHGPSSWPLFRALLFVRAPWSQQTILGLHKSKFSPPCSAGGPQSALKSSCLRSFSRSARSSAS